MTLPANLPDILRDAGLKVHEVAGWRDRKRPGDFGPVGVLCHHTATNRASSDDAVISLLLRGRSDLPGPLCQLGLSRDGTVHIIAAGRGNHAGEARSSGTVAAGDGNRLYIGIEAFNDGVGEPWPQVQYEAYVLLCAVLSVKVTGNSVNTVRGHKETSVTGKIDPTFDMNQFRDRVQAEMTRLAAPPPTPDVKLRGIHLCLAGDWNEGPRSIGRYSPAWIAKQGGLRVYGPPPNKRGQVGIDYMLSSAPCTNVRRLEEDHSDHEPIAFDITHPVVTLRKSLRGCTFNVRRDRTPIEREALRRWLSEQPVDFYALQECKQYQALLRSVEGFTLVVPDEMPDGGDHNAILVRNGIAVTEAATRQTSAAGWFTKTGASHVPSTVALATLDGWLRVGSVHEVVSTDLRDGTWLGPVRRVAARISSARTLAKIGRYWKARR